MSRLFGPLSETISRVSWRDCALAGDHTAGAAGSAVPAAIAVIDLRNSRRFIDSLPLGAAGGVPQGPCQSRTPRGRRRDSAQAVEAAGVMTMSGALRGERVGRLPLHTIRRRRSNF